MQGAVADTRSALGAVAEASAAAALPADTRRGNRNRNQHWGSEWECPRRAHMLSPVNDNIWAELGGVALLE